MDCWIYRPVGYAGRNGVDVCARRSLPDRNGNGFTGRRIDGSPRRFDGTDRGPIRHLVDCHDVVIAEPISRDVESCRWLSAFNEPPRKAQLVSACLHDRFAFKI